MGVSVNNRFDSDLVIFSPLPFPSTCISTIFLVGGGGGVRHSFFKIYPPPIYFPINHSTYSLWVSLFLVRFHLTVYIVLYVFVLYDPYPYRRMGVGEYVPCAIIASPSYMFPPPVTTSLPSTVTVIPLSTFFFPLGYQPMIS